MGNSGKKPQCLHRYVQPYFSLYGYVVNGIAVIDKHSVVSLPSDISNCLPFLKISSSAQYKILSPALKGTFLAYFDPIEVDVL